MTGQTEIWVSQAHWRDRWDEVKQLPGGGQGNAWRVRRKGDGRDGFLKAIRAKRDPERRARFSREANAYATVTDAACTGHERRTLTRIRVALPHLLPAVCDQLVTVRIPKVTAVEVAGAAGTR